MCFRAELSDCMINLRAEVPGKTREPGRFRATPELQCRRGSKTGAAGIAAALLRVEVRRVARLGVHRSEESWIRR